MKILEMIFHGDAIFDHDHAELTHDSLADRGFHAAIGRNASDDEAR